MCANGPLAWSVLAFNHAMIFHSYVPWMQRKNNWRTTPRYSKHELRPLIHFLGCSVVPICAVWCFWLRCAGPHDFSCGARLSFAFIVWSSMVCSTSLGYFNGSNALPYLWWWCWKLFECLFLNLAIWDDDAILPLVADFVLRVDLCCSGLLHRTSCLPDVVGPNIGRLLNARSCMPKAIQVHPNDTQTPKRYCAIHFLKDLTHMLS